MGMGMFSMLGVPLGYVMRWLYMLIGNYGWTIIVFTFLMRIVLIPLSIQQQKSSARMAAYQPMIKEIQKKWANDKNRQNQELQKFYEENNLKMTAGCLPTIVNMLVIFGIIAVIQSPLTTILQLPQEEVDKGVRIVMQHQPDSKISGGYVQQSLLIGEISENESIFLQETEVPVNADEPDGPKEMIKMDSEVVEKIRNFDFQFMGMNLAAVPTIAMNRYLILPILSILTMFASQLIIMLTSGGSGMQGRTQMIVMTLVMGAMFGYFAFTVPVGFSLYYTASNIVMTIQQVILKRIYDPEKIREKVMQEIEDKKKTKKAKKQVKIRQDDGEVVTAELSEAELVKLRLERARQLDAERYSEDDKPDNSEEATEKAKALDEEKYGNNSEKIGDDNSEEQDAADEEEQETEPQEKAQYKPGRRKRARKNKEAGEESFADKEMRREESSAVMDDKEGN